VNLRVLSYNIRKGGTGRERALAAVMTACEPDIVIIQEAYDALVVEQLASVCGMKHWAAAAGHSVGFISRLPVGGHVWRRVRWARRAYLELELADSGFTIFGVHLSAVHSNLTEQRRAYEVRALLKSVERHQHGVHLVTGDFNTLAPNERLDMRRLPPRIRAFAWVTGKTIRWVTIRMMLEAGYADGFRALHPSGEGNTFPARDPQLRLDYAFVPESYRDAVRECDVVRDVPGVAEASDHLPLVTEIDIGGHEDVTTKIKPSPR
jgi:endonuclease/exonuclease/phosphatase family metal-dependent hydrolase